MKIAFFELKNWERDYLAERLTGWELWFDAERMSESSLPAVADAEVISPFVRSRLSRQILERLPNLRFIPTRSTGVDHIDLDACRERGIRLSNVPTYGEYTVAEHTFALILSLSRNVHKSYLRVMEGKLELAALTGFDLKDKTLGVIGAGRIGLHVIRIARGFGMRVLTFDARQDAFLAELLGFEYTPLETLLRSSDIITLHVPYLPATHHLINRDTLRMVKKGALLINTARGPLVETDALAWALDEGILAGVGLDVIEGEENLIEEKQILDEPHTVETLRQILRTHILLKRDNVVFTPHNAFNSREALRRILDTTLDNIEGWRRNAPLNLVV